MWVVADLDEDYITKMEDVLEVYEQPYDPQQPVVCLDEKPITLHADVRPASPVAPGREARRDSAVKLVDVLAGVSPAGANCPVGTVVISGDGAGDQTVGSPEVKALDGWMQVWSAPTGGLAKQQVVAKA